MAQWLAEKWLHEINEVQKDLQRSQDLIDRAAQCGMECQEVQKTRDEHWQALQQWKEVFFPQRGQG